MKSRTRFTGILFLSLLGIADSWYLAQHALTNTALSCGIDTGPLSGCNTVAQSAYSHFFGIPLGIYGIVFYAAMLLIALAAQYAWVRGATFLLALGSAVGLAASIYFEALQLFVIDALCIYCLGSFLFSLGIFLLALPYWKRQPVELAPPVQAPS